jgi:hypothetical protein
MTLNAIQIYNCPSVCMKDWFQDHLWIPKSGDDQVPYIKWHSIAQNLLLPNTLAHLYITYTQ